MSPSPLYLGIDLGTGGGRALVTDASGKIIASATVPFPRSNRTLPAGHHEQDAREWWSVTSEVIAHVVAMLAKKGITADAIAALAVDGTSGTVVGVDAQGLPVGPGLMYNDGRASEEARELAKGSAAAGPSPAGQIAASYAIAKILWLQRHTPESFARTKWFVHQADYIASMLTGRWGITDYSNALKTGYDLLTGDWPAWLSAYSLIRERLPAVVAPGSLLGTITPPVATRLGLSSATRIIAGATDGTAGFLASGTHEAGQINTTLGTTLVFKQLAAAPVIDPSGLIYCHKLPGPRDAAGLRHDLWLPGAASNTGCEWIAIQYPVADFTAMDGEAQAYFPCENLAYPLARQGERFPFSAPTAMAFCEPCESDSQAYAAQLQGVALVERLCYESLGKACGIGQEQARAPIFATGGGARSDIWMHLRADVTGRVYHRPACPESAFGAAILAAAPDNADLPSAVRAMVRIERTFEPNGATRERYDAIHERFKLELIRRGIMPSV